VQPAKQAKSEGVKLKLSTPKTPKEPAQKKTPKAKSSSKKSATKVEGSDEDESMQAVEKTLTPAEAMEKKEKEGKTRLAFMHVSLTRSSSIHPPQAAKGLLGHGQASDGG
jgi:Tfp pilus assembly protein FimT